MSGTDWFGVCVLVAIVGLWLLMAWDLRHPSTLEDKPLRQAFLDDRQVQAAREEADEHQYSDWFDQLVADTHAVETDRIAKRARGECSCTVPDSGRDNCLIADRRCPIHGGFHD